MKTMYRFNGHNCGHGAGLKQGVFTVGNLYEISYDDGTDSPSFKDDYGNSFYKYLDDFTKMGYDAREMNLSRTALDDLIFTLPRVFIWDNTPEGHKYWADIEKKLQTIREQTRGE